MAAVDMSRDAHTAASATDEVKLWDVAQGSTLASVAGAGFVPDRFARCFRMGKDGSVLWAGPAFVKRHEDDSTISYGCPALKRWHPGDPAISLVEHPEVSALVALSADGRRALVTRGRDRAEELTLYELGDTPRCVALPMPGPSFAVSTAVMSAGGLRAASADYEHDLFVWDLKRAVTPLPQPQLVPWHGMMFAGFSTDGCSAVFERADGTVTIIDVESGAAVANAAVPEIWRDPPDSASTARESDGHGDTPRSRRGRKARGKTSANDYPVDDFGQSRGHTATVMQVRRSRNERWEATVSHDGRARVWTWPAIARSLPSRARWVSLAVTGHRTAARWR